MEADTDADIREVAEFLNSHYGPPVTGPAIVRLLTMAERSRLEQLLSEVFTWVLLRTVPKRRRAYAVHPVNRVLLEQAIVEFPGLGRWLTMEDGLMTFKPDASADVEGAIRGTIRDVYRPAFSD